MDGVTASEVGEEMMTGIGNYSFHGQPHLLPSDFFVSPFSHTPLLYHIYCNQATTRSDRELA